MSFFLYPDGGAEHASPYKNISGEFFRPTERIINDVAENNLEENNDDQYDGEENADDDLRLINDLIRPGEKPMNIYGSPLFSMILFTDLWLDGFAGAGRIHGSPGTATVAYFMFLAASTSFFPSSLVPPIFS